MRTSAVRTIGMLVLALAAGCTGDKEAPATVSAVPAASVPTQGNEHALPVTRTPEPPLDVAGLKARLQDTPAIGAFTKLALRNQLDDLLKRFRAHYQSGQKTGVARLQQRYDMLVLKVLCVFQDSDPSLARSVLQSREAIWGTLADPEKFNSAT